MSGSLGVGTGSDVTCDYGGVVRGNGIMGIQRNTKMGEIIDGTSNTILIAEQSAYINVDGSQVNRTSNYYGGWSGSAGGFATDRSGRPHWGSGTTCLRYPINHGFGNQVITAA